MPRSSAVCGRVMSDFLGSINTSEHKTISVQVFVGRTFPGQRRIMSTRIGQSRCCHRMQFKFQFNSRPTKKIISIIVSTNYWPRLTRIYHPQHLQRQHLDGCCAFPVAAAGVACNARLSLNVYRRLSVAM